MKIPIGNLYYLLSYAWDRLEEAGVVNVDDADYRQIADLFGRVLCGGLDHVLKRGLDRGYVEHTESIPGVRGKINLGESIKANIFSTGRAVCTFEELSLNVAHNQILKATAALLLRSDELDVEIRHRLRDTAARITGVDSVPLTGTLFRRLQLHRNNGFYDFLMKVCWLIFDSVVIDERSGRAKFRDFVRNEELMSDLFERFLFNFYARETTGFRVRRETIRWNASGTEQDLSYLPQMRTDVTLEREGIKIIIDAKYYLQPLQTHFGKDTVRSSHLYQLFSYLVNSRVSSAKAPVALLGVLVYPLAGMALDLRFEIDGHQVHVATVDLAEPWRAIHTRLRHLVT